MEARTFGASAFSRKPFVLVVGSAHMDVFGDFPSNLRTQIDREGEVFCAIGGSGFNIAVDLANEGRVSVGLFTHIRAESPVSDIILARLLEEKVSTQYVIRDIQIQRDSGFVAHRADGELVSAVSSMPVEDADFNTMLLESAIQKASVVVADCNLSASQLTLIAGLCSTHQRKLIVSGVSESKCKRVQLLSSDSNGKAPIACFCINKKESRALMGKNSDPEEPEFANNICRVAHAEHVVVTEGKDGWLIYSVDGTIQRFEAPRVGSVVSSSGAGDAVVAAIANCIALQGHLEWPLIKTTVHRFVDRVLRKRVSSGADLTSLETLALSQRSLARYLSQPKIKTGAITMAIVTGLGLLAALIQAAVSLETSKVIWPRLRTAYCFVASDSAPCDTEWVPVDKMPPESK
jgi:pseudouridine kinase